MTYFGTFTGGRVPVILTGPAIAEAVARGEILIDPFDPAQLNPNSYNYRLHSEIVEITADAEGRRSERRFRLPEKGHVFRPRRLYLGCTLERFASPHHAMTILGRSSLGRLGVFLVVSADLGHRGSDSRWTLEITVVQPVRLYPGMRIGQVAFWLTAGSRAAYRGRYHGDLAPVPNRDALLVPSPSREEAA